MATGKQHPHTAMPSDDDLREIATRLQPHHEALYLAAHALIVDTLPDVRSEVDLVDGSIGYGIRQFGYGGWGMASLSVHKGWVSLFLMKGVEVPDPDGVLDGSGKLLRHVKLRSVEELEERSASLRAVLTAASRLHA